jgi:hypothetical protein
VLGTFTPIRAHLFFLGAAFLLLEVHAVNRLALLFGTTWIVSAAAIATVLCLIIAANLTTVLTGGVPYGLSYAGFFVSAAPSGDTSKPAIRGRLKTGHRERCPDVLVGVTG